MSDLLLWFARLILASVIIVAAWAFGGVDVDLQPWLVAGTLLSTGFWFLGLLLKKPTSDQRNTFAWSRSLVILSLGILLGIIQIFPGLGDRIGPREIGRTPESLVEQYSSNDKNDDANELDCIPSRVTIQTPFLSLYPASTQTTLAQIVLAVLVFILGAGLFGRFKDQIVLYWIIGINGAILSIFGIYQKLNFDGRLFGKFQISGNAQPFASFVNRNNASGFLNLSLAACLGILFWSIYRFDFKESTGIRINTKQSMAQRFSMEVRQLMSSIDVTTLFAIIITMCTAAGVVASVSRAGIVSAVLAILFLAVILVRVGYSRITFLTGMVVVVGGIALISAAGVSEQFQSRFETLTYEEAKTNARFKNWSEAVYAIPDFPIFGTGLGTYRYAHLPYQHLPNDGWFYHAENQYFQTLFEAGIVGTVLLAILLLLTMLDLKKLLSWSGLRFQDPLPLVASFAFITQLLHSVFDFGLYLPANMMLFALIIGIASSKASLLRRLKSSASDSSELSLSEPPSSNQQSSGHVSAIAASLFCALLGTCSYLELNSRAQAGYEIESVHSVLTSEEKNLDQINGEIESFQKSAEARPNDVEVHLSLARLYIDRYRHQTMKSIEDVNVQNRVIEKQKGWAATSLRRLHNTVLGFKSQNQTQTLNRLLEYPEVKTNLKPAYKHLQLARRCCPIVARVYLSEANLKPLYEQASSEDAAFIQVAAALNPSKAAIQEEAGQLAFQLDQSNLALCCWNRCLNLNSAARERIIETAILRWPPKIIAEQIIPDDPKFLVAMVRKWMKRVVEVGHLQLLAVNKAKRLLANDRDDLEPGEREYLLARCEILLGEPEKAIAHFEDALKKDSLNALWYYELSIVLLREEKFDQAIEQGRKALLYDPKNKQYKKHFSKLNRAR